MDNDKKDKDTAMVVCLLVGNIYGGLIQGW
jgi:hypothetical protein